ncbi:MAG: hypothetical protein HOP11_12350 [Saprospiraceae bacterium]|nr:hypothetical protein [Saprospiraceae bacterium]
MRKLFLDSTTLTNCFITIRKHSLLYYLSVFLAGYFLNPVKAESDFSSLSGRIFLSTGNSVNKSINSAFNFIAIYAFDEKGELAGNSIRNIFGNYYIQDLQISKKYKISTQSIPVSLNIQGKSDEIIISNGDNRKDLLVNERSLLSFGIKDQNLEVLKNNELSFQIISESANSLSGSYGKDLQATPCFCLKNATETGNGQFSTTLKLVSGRSEQWFIRYVNGLFSISSPSPPNSPIPFVTGSGGQLLIEDVTSDTSSNYFLSGIFVSGIGFDIILENNYGDKVSLGNISCNYELPVVLESSNNACVNSTVKYTVRQRPGSAYQWNLATGGTIISNPLAHSIQVQWSGAPGTTHLLSVKEINSSICIEPLNIPVTIGNVSGNVACIGNAQISLDANCEALVSAKNLLVGGPYDFNSYAVQIFNKDGSLVPNNIVNYSHINKPAMTAKVINTCTGNSCWTKITVEDKLSPTIVCQNDTIDCTRMKSHLGPFIYDNCDPNPTKILISETIENTPCNTLYSKIVHRQYQAKDASGNLSKICKADFFLKRILFDSIQFPDSLTSIKENSLLCGKYPLDSLGRPLPEYTGIPTYFGHNLWPNKDTKYCDFSISFEDYITSGTNCTRKINRVWKIVIWYCTTSKIITYNQLIEIYDREGPVIHCPYDKEVFTNSSNCEADVYIAPINAVDSCKNGVNLILTYPGGVIKKFAGGFIKLPVGTHVVNVQAFDNCYNITDCFFNIEVLDKAAPTAICDRETTVSLDRFGEAWIPAYIFDDGSYDNCHIKSMKVRRMDNGLPCNYNSVLADSVGFCCEDVGKLITVLFQVTDESGNTNTCMIQVEVQDKTIPKISCPHDVTIDCNYHFKRNDLSEFGVAIASDNCKVTVIEKDSFNINQCNEGFIYRIFTAGNSFGSDTCIQTIHIINDTPFVENNIIWPLDLDTMVCNVSVLSPELLAAKYRPRITEDRCDLVGVNYEDHVFKFVSGSDACFKILRKWKIINWCRFKDVMSKEPIVYEHVQILKANNKQAPIILTGCENQRAEISDTSCTLGRISLISTASDDCTPDIELINFYQIDLDSDGRIDFQAQGAGARIDASGRYKFGKHRIKYIFEDRCGNKAVCEKDFEIINVKLPSAYCKKGIAVGLEAMDLNNDGRLDGEFATIWAKDLDQGSNHICGYDITLSFGRDSSKHSITYNCDSIGRRTVLLCATASNGRQDCCETFIDVQDNNNVDFCGCLKRPTDLTINSCTQITDPISINSFPRFGLCICDSNRVTSTDIIVRNIPNICYRIQRNWTVEFLCAGSAEVISFTQNIDVTTNLKASDIVWPSDSITVDNCDGSRDTSRIGGVPRVCLYDGNVMLMFSDTEVPSRPNTRLFIRRWNVFSKCVLSQSFFFDQKILVVNPIGTKITIPADITVNSCSRPFLPDSLNGFPIAACGCDSITNTFRDDTIRINNEICYLVNRTWNVRVRCRPTIDTVFTGIQRITRDVNLDPNDIIWPVDTFRSFSCSANSSPDRTGRPSLRTNYCGLISFTFADVNISNATCTTVRRTWTATNPCSPTQTLTRVQILIFFNQSTFSLTCAPDITVNADPNTCGARVNVPNPSLISNCNFGITITNNAPVIFPVGKTNVIFTARDTCNRFSTCTTMVTVLENVPPTLTCPRDTSVECSANTQNLNQFGIATASDNCPGLTLRDSVLRAQNVCGIGEIRRFIIATDASGNRASCLQTITVTNSDPLDSLEINWPQSPITVLECAPFGPSNTGIPIIIQGAASCFKVRITSTDTAFCIPGNCEVNRKWTVFDSCANNTFMFVQRIIRLDTTAPTILGIKDTSIFANDSTCSGFVNIKALVNNCDSNVIKITNNSNFGGNGMNDASGFYPAGMTTVTFTATDGCCNVSMKSVVITVIDTVKPEVTCKKAIKRIADNGCAVFNARDFIVTLTDNCSPPPQIMASFDKNNFNDTLREICCDSIMMGQFTQTITVYFKDVSGNITECQTLLQAIDENRICGNFTSVLVSGQIKSRRDRNLANVPVTLQGSLTGSAQSNYLGYYSFGNIPLGGTYTVFPHLNVDPLDGVSTYDIVQLQQHILGKKLFSDPFQYIAGDVNKSRTITSADISEIRKLILGTTEKFSKNNSWRFIVSDYKFINRNDPLNDDWPETYTIKDINTHTWVGFTGIKIGDIDDSHKYAGFGSGIQTRSAKDALWQVSNNELKANETKVIKLSLKNSADYLGAQGSVYIDTRYFRIVRLSNENSTNISSENISLQESDKGLVKFSWINTDLDEECVIAIEVTALSHANVIDHISFNDNSLLSEAYDKYNNLVHMKFGLVDELHDKFASNLILYQNIPNPFNQITRIPFEINIDSDISLEIYDINSKLVLRNKAKYKKGYHEIEIKKSDLPGSGLFYYQLRTSTEQVNKRMLMID